MNINFRTPPPDGFGSIFSSVADNIPCHLKLGVRVQMLIDRGVASTNSGSKRWVKKLISTDEASFDSNVKELMEIQLAIGSKDVRLYGSVNPRKFDKAVKLFLHRQIDLDRYKRNDEYINFYSSINDKFVSCLMKPENSFRNYYLIDVDTKDEDQLKEIDDIVRTKLFEPTESFGADWELVVNHAYTPDFVYDTPNGKHYIVRPFDVRKLKLEHLFYCEVKKDGLIWIT